MHADSAARVHGDAGASRDGAAPPAVASALRQLGALSDLELDALGAHALPIVHNHRDEIGGEGRADFPLNSGKA